MVSLDMRHLTSPPHGARAQPEGSTSRALGGSDARSAGEDEVGGSGGDIEEGYGQERE